MAKLFAFEDMDGVGTLGDEVEVSPEELETAQELPAVQEESTDIGQHSEAIDEAVDATNDLEEVKDVVERSIEEEGGLSPVAAEAVRIAVESICARIGASPRSLFSLYATENYRSSSARLANSRIAMEGIGDFIRDLWERIKKAVKNIWDKIVEFWEKHVSTLGQLAKALDKLYDKVGYLSGSPERDEVKAPSSLGKAFCWVGTIDKNVIKNTLTAHVTFTSQLDSFQSGADALKNGLKDILKNFDKNLIATSYKELIDNVKNAIGRIEAGNQNQPLITGVYYKSELNVENESGEVFNSFNFVRNQVDEVEDHDLKVLSVTEMREVIKSAKVLVVKSMDVKRNISKARKDLDEGIEAMDKFVEKVEKEYKEGTGSQATTSSQPEQNKKQGSGKSKTEVAKEDASQSEVSDIKKYFKALSSVFAKFQSSYGRFASDIISLNVRAASSVIVAVNTSAKEYKKSK